MIGCYYCVDYDLEEGTCSLYGDPVDNCDSFEFDTGIDDGSIENGGERT